MQYKLIEELYKDIESSILDKLKIEKTNLICRGSGFPSDFPYLVVDNNGTFRAKFNSLNDAKTYVDNCL